MFNSVISCLVLVAVWWDDATEARYFEQDLEIVSRSEWGARPPTLVENMTNPVPYVVIHHSYIPPACSTKEECIAAMKWMQDYHQFNQSWNDIGYSFASGSDNRIYTGRGWSAVGAHAPGFNNQSIGICIIGNWMEQLPPSEQLETVKQFISLGVKQGYIMEDYKLIGHRQARDTDCPGDALFAEIQTWPEWDPSVNVTGKRPFNTRKQEPIAVKEIPNDSDNMIRSNGVS